MYAQHFGLKQDPFSIAPDPRYLFMSERHREALAHLLYGLGGGGGFVLLSGEIGTGKTTVCRCFLEQIPANCNVAYIFNPKLTVIELLQTICDEFHIAVPDGAVTAKDYIDPLNAFLLEGHAAGRNNVLIIDEAQNLSADVLEQLRLLTNLETSERKLLQIVLIGQPELRRMLARPELEQLAQRVIARFHLDALSESETTQYIAHRLAVAGHTGALPFDAKALRRIHQVTRGVPRRINLLCGRAMLGAYAHGSVMVTRAIVDKACGEVFDSVESAQASMHKPSRVKAPVRWAIGGAAAAVVVAAAVWTVDSEKPKAGAARPVPAAGTTAKPARAASATPVAVPAASGESAALFKTLLRDETQAWRELGPKWKLPAADGDPCEAAQRQQVYCFGRPMSLALIRQLDRPGIVTLYDAGDKPAYAVLEGLTADSARLRSGGVSQTVPLAALAQAWRGEFATYWRAPPGYGSRINDRSTGPTVDWLAVKLAALDGSPAPTGAQSYDATLKARVQALQRAQGLEADGRVGPMTFMQLNRAAGIDEPRLSTEPR